MQRPWSEDTTPQKELQNLRHRLPCLRRPWGEGADPRKGAGFGGQYRLQAMRTTLKRRQGQVVLLLLREKSPNMTFLTLDKI